MTERRRRTRTETNVAGRLTSGRLDVPCEILDLSTTGARLRIQPGLFLPQALVLRTDQLGDDRQVEVVWRNRTQLGVRF